MSINLGDTSVIQNILAQLATMNARLGSVERVKPLGISGATVNASGHLIISYTDGSTGDAGLVTGGVVPPIVPLLTLTGPLTFAANAAAGTLVANIGNVPTGVTPTLTPNDGRLVIAGNASSGWTVVVGLTASTAGTIALSIAATGATSASVTVTVTAAGLVLAYAQGMGATNASGFVDRIALPQDGLAQRIYLDATNGNDANNGWSPTAGKAPNGTGPAQQYGATALVNATTDANGKTWGPKKTLYSFVASLPKNSGAGVGHQICLRQGDTYTDGTVSQWTDGFPMKWFYGASASAPFCIQTYDPADPLNEQKMGVPPVSKMPIVNLSTDKAWNFKTNANTDDGLIGNFAFRGFAVRGSDGTRFQPDCGWSLSFSGDNWLWEGIDFGPCKTAFNNTTDSGNNGYERWSRNVIIRNCLFYGANQSANAYGGVGQTANSMGVYWEDNKFLHALWPITSEGRAPLTASDTSVPNDHMHDIYLAADSQSPNIVRRNVSIDASQDFLSSRNGSIAYQNLVIDAAIAMSAAGSSSNPTLEHPNHSYYDVHHNAVIGSAPIDMARVVFTGQPGVGNASGVDLINYHFEFVNADGSGATGNGTPVKIGASAQATCDNLAAAANASTQPQLQGVTWRTYMNGSTPELRQYPKTDMDVVVPVGSGGQGLSKAGGTYLSTAFGAGNGTADVQTRDGLAVDSGVYGYGGNNPRPGLFSLNVGSQQSASTANFTNIDGYMFGVSSGDAVGVAGTGLNTPGYQPLNGPTFTNVNYNATTPYTKKQIIQQQWGYANKAALVAAIAANFTAPWATNLLTTLTTMFGKSFAVPDAGQQFTFTSTTLPLTPKIGDTVTFPNPTLGTGEKLLSADTYAGMNPVPNTGAGTNTLNVINDTSSGAIAANQMFGKRLSRIVVSGTPGGKVNALLVEIKTPVAAGVTPVSISGTPASTAKVGTAYSFTPTTANGSGTKTFALTGTLPAGLSFSTTTGAISGTPTATGTASGLNITVTDSSGSASLGAFSIAVSNATAGALPSNLVARWDSTSGVTTSGGNLTKWTDTVGGYVAQPSSVAGTVTPNGWATNIPSIDVTADGNALTTNLPIAQGARFTAVMVLDYQNSGDGTFFGCGHSGPEFDYNGGNMRYLFEHVYNALSVTQSISGRHVIGVRYGGGNASDGGTQSIVIALDGTIIGSSDGYDSNSGGGTFNLFMSPESDPVTHGKLVAFGVTSSALSNADFMNWMTYEKSKFGL